jgi:hypothetical protein
MGIHGNSTVLVFVIAVTPSGLAGSLPCPRQVCPLRLKNGALILGVSGFRFMVARAPVRMNSPPATDRPTGPNRTNRTTLRSSCDMPTEKYGQMRVSVLRSA